MTDEFGNFAKNAKIKIEKSVFEAYPEGHIELRQLCEEVLKLPSEQTDYLHTGFEEDSWELPRLTCGLRVWDVASGRGLRRLIHQNDVPELRHRQRLLGLLQDRTIIEDGVKRPLSLEEVVSCRQKLADVGVLPPIVAPLNRRQKARLLATKFFDYVTFNDGEKTL